ncbi:hypothetical protein LPJ70_007010, partial [Coemansia sp. RSA 2708]
CHFAAGHLTLLFPSRSSIIWRRMNGGDGRSRSWFGLCGIRARCWCLCGRWSRRRRGGGGLMGARRTCWCRGWCPDQGRMGMRQTRCSIDTTTCSATANSPSWPGRSPAAHCTRPPAAPPRLWIWRLCTRCTSTSTAPFIAAPANQTATLPPCYRQSTCSWRACSRSAWSSWPSTACRRGSRSGSSANAAPAPKTTDQSSTHTLSRRAPRGYGTSRSGSASTFPAAAGPACAWCSRDAATLARASKRSSST